jgi:hypothetical protein
LVTAIPKLVPGGIAVVVVDGCAVEPMYGVIV